MDVERVQHGYDRAGNRLWRRNPVALTNFAFLDELYFYDGIYRIREVQRGELDPTRTNLLPATKNFAQGWGLDATGNWGNFLQDDTGGGTWNLNQTRTHSEFNEITAISGGGWVQPSYDAAGNIVTMPQPPAPTIEFSAVYDAWNRLITISTGGSALGAYLYDGLGRRVTKLVSATTRHFYYSATWQALEERLGTSTSPDRQFVLGLRYIDDLVLRDRGSERFFGIQDTNFNLTAIADVTGAIQERYAYTPYGNPTVLTAAFGSRGSSSYDWETRYAGYRWDSETGLYSVRNRLLQPELGRWATPDPAWFDRGRPGLRRLRHRVRRRHANRADSGRSARRARQSCRIRRHVHSRQ